MSEMRSITENAPEMIAEAIRWGRRTRFNPLGSLSGASLTRSLENFERGELREAALLWDAIARRDDTIPSVKAKREKSVAHKPLETVTLEKSAEADAHRDVLEAFWKNVRYVNAWERNDRGGVQKLIRSMQSAVSYQYAAHHIIWQPTPAGLRATFEYVPTWFFEARDSLLRFLPLGYGLEGQDLEEQNWMIGFGDALMFASSIGYYLKRSSLQDWLRFSEKFAMPGVFGKTSAEKDSEEGRAMREAVSSFGQEWAAVLYGHDGSKTSGIELIQANGNPSAMPMPALIERVDKKIAALYRGADLSSMSSGTNTEGTGASLQGEEQDILERADAADRSEELQAVERTVIGWHFGAGTEPLAQTRLIVPEREDQKLLLEATKTFVSLGAKIGMQGTLSRFGLSEADEDETAFVPETAKQPAAVAAPVIDVKAEELPANLETGLNAFAEQLGLGKIEGVSLSMAAGNAAHDGWRFQRRDKNGRWTDDGGRDALFTAVKHLLETEGGFTVDLSGVSYRSGFAVAPERATDRRKPAESFTEQDLDDYIDDFWPLLTRDRAKLGGWIAGGDAVLDVSIVVRDFDEALDLAIAGEQDAFFDLEKRIEYNTNEEATKREQRRAAGNADPGRSGAVSLRRGATGRGQGNLQDADQGRTAQAGNPDSGREAEPLSGEDEEVVAPPVDQIAALLMQATVDGFQEAQGDDATSAANTATTDAIWKDDGTSGGDRMPAILTAANAAIAPDEDGWYQIAPYGEFETVDKKFIQVFTRKEAEAMVRHFNSVPFKITRWLFNNEIPVFIGHPDVDRKNWSDERKLAVRHTELAAREDGLWGRADWNALGLDNLANGYWEFPSPVWLFPKPDGLLKRAGAKLFGRELSNRVYPDILQSVGLTNFQNIPDARRVTHNALGSDDGTTQENEEDDTMNPELLAALGLDENATMEQVLAKIAEMKQAAEAAVAEKTKVEGEMTAMNATLESVRTDLQSLRTTSANAMLDTAITGGAITQGERAGWEQRFLTDYQGAANALSEIKPGSTGLNTKSVGLPNKPQTAPQTAVERIAAFNAAVKEHAAKHPGLGYDACVAAVRNDPSMAHIVEAMKPSTEEAE
jgi:phage gp29-like protein